MTPTQALGPIEVLHDVVVQIHPNQVSKFEKLFPIEDYYCPPKEILQDEVVRSGSFNLIHQESGIKIDIVLSKDTEYHRSEFSRRLKVEILPKFEVFIAQGLRI